LALERKCDLQNYANTLTMCLKSLVFSENSFLIVSFVLYNFFLAHETKRVAILRTNSYSLSVVEYLIFTFLGNFLIASQLAACSKLSTKINFLVQRFIQGRGNVMKATGPQLENIPWRGKYFKGANNKHTFGRARI